MGANYHRTKEATWQLVVPSSKGSPKAPVGGVWEVPKQRSMRLKWLLLLLVLRQAFPKRQCEPLITGEWHAIKDPKDPHVQKTGEFAVAEYNKEKKAVLLTFKGVISGALQVMSGVKFRLQVEGMEEGESKTYEAVVWKKACEGPMALTSFNPAR